MGFSSLLRALRRKVQGVHIPADDHQTPDSSDADLFLVPSRSTFQLRPLRRKTLAVHSLADLHQLTDTSDTLSLVSSHSTFHPACRAAPSLPVRTQEASRSDPCRLPIEVWEYILDFVKYSVWWRLDPEVTRTLAACCLVCKAFFPRSRLLLLQNLEVRLESAHDLERFVRSFRASPTLCQQVRTITIKTSYRTQHSWVSCALLQLSTYEYGAWLRLEFDSVDMQGLNPMVLRAWARHRVNTVRLWNVYFTRYSQLQPFLSIAEAVTIRPDRECFPASRSFGNLTAAPHHVLRHLILHTDLSAAAVLMDTTWFSSSVHLVKLGLYPSDINDPSFSAPDLGSTVTHALDLFSRSQALQVHFNSLMGWEIQLDPHGILVLDLRQDSRFEKYLPQLAALFWTVSLSTVLHTLRLQVFSESRDTFEVDAARWEALDNALSRSANESAILYYELRIGVPAASVHRNHLCTNNVIQAILPKFTLHRVPVNAHCTSCGLHEIPQVDEKEKKGHEADEDVGGDEHEYSILGEKGFAGHMKGFRDQGIPTAQYKKGAASDDEIC
ncbi:hypothetical protein EIP91_000387 [Steccherinum ochraceum]|uniref:Uncharacterized protein n=1 Tax=Steccherinum ochraceum TaxID=92696 RepID=A0A4R0RG50_9APHY|nr:hypothetical protein EIP91_000387 [Steccherinum ochraceum]